jgi:hypothetical protein
MPLLRLEVRGRHSLGIEKAELSRWNEKHSFGFIAIRYKEKVITSKKSIAKS